MSAEPRGPDPDDYVRDGSIRWGELAGGAAGAFVTAGTIVAVDAWNLVTGGVGSLVGTAFDGLAGFVSSPFGTGESAVVESFRVGASALPATGAFAFPLAVIMTVVSVSIVLWGVSRLAG